MEYYTLLQIQEQLVETCSPAKDIFHTHFRSKENILLTVLLDFPLPTTVEMVAGLGFFRFTHLKSLQERMGQYE